MIEYNNGMPVYWRNESSGKLEEAVNAYWMPCANLSANHVNLLRQYIVHWATAPCWRNNPYLDAGIEAELDKAIALSRSITTRSDICDALDSLMTLAIDPF